MNVGLSFGAHGFGHGGATQIVAYAVDLRFDPQQMTLCERLSQLPQADPGIRAQIDEAAMRHGWPVLHAQLAALDPETAGRLEPNDAQRIQRALEVVRLTGRPLAASYARRDAAELPYRLHAIGLAPSDRAAPHARIAQRFDAMLTAGLIDEVHALRQKYALDAALPSMRCVGYRQVWQFIYGALLQDELRERGIYATRQLAKRQLTWMRAMAGLEVFDCCDSTGASTFASRVAAWLSGGSARQLPSRT